MILFVLLLVTFALAAPQTECPNPGLSFCNLNQYLEGRTGPVCDIVDLDGCEERFSELTAESWADLYTTIECYCEQPEVQYFLKTAATPAVILFDQISAEFHHDYSTDDRRALSSWGWEQWTSFGVSTAISVTSIGFALFFGRRELADTKSVTFDFNEIFHTCNAMNVPTSFCNELMSDNSFEFSQICGGELNCVHDLDSLMKVVETAQQTTLAQTESHEDCPDFGLGYCVLHYKLNGKSGPVCDIEGLSIDNCQSQYEGMYAEDYNHLYEASGMDCFCSREDVQQAVAEASADVILFDMTVASSHVPLPARRALAWGWQDWTAFITSTVLGVGGIAAALMAGRRLLETQAIVHFDWSNIVQVCAQYNAFDMCEMPADVNVKEFEYLCLGKADCDVTLKDLNKLLKYNHIKQITGEL